MINVNAKQRTLFIGLCILVLGVTNSANADNSAFAHFKFGSDVSVDVPRNWYFLDKNIRDNLNTFSEAAVRLAGISAAQGNNQILIAANAYTNSKKPSATMRLSVRRGNFISQSDVQDSDIKKIKMMTKKQIDKLNESLPDYVKSMKLVSVRVEKIGGYYSVVTKKLVEYDTGLEVDRLDVIYFPKVVYKLNTSYRKNEEWMFKPILEIVRNSLSIPAI